MDQIFGPVLSRRLGLSLGVDLLPMKTCSMDCNYCEIGPTTCLTMERRPYVSGEAVLKEIRAISRQEFDYLTFAGSGEPTLHSRLGEIVRAAKKLTDRPVVIITNSSLFSSSKVREEVAEADLVLPSMDAVTQATFEVINRPAAGLRVEDIIRGLSEFRKEFSGEIWLEIMLVRGINQLEAPLIAEVAESLRPDRIQLNTVVRPPPEPVEPLTEEEMISMLDVFPAAEIIPDWDWFVPPGIESHLLGLLGRECLTPDEIRYQMGINARDVMKYLKILEREGKVQRLSREGKLYFQFRDNGK